MDLIARYQVPPLVRGVPLGDGITAFPLLPRARRSPSERVKPFDAGEIEQRERGLDIQFVSITSLIRRLNNRLTEDPDERTAGSADETRQLLRELTNRGLNAERFIRTVIGPAISVNIIAKAVMPFVGAPSDDDPDLTADVAAWSEIYVDSTGVLQDAATPADSPEAVERRVKALFRSAVRSEFLGRVLAYLNKCDLEAFISWRPPTKEHFASLHPAAMDLDSEDQWLADRFGRTYLHEWQPSSLKREWLYTTGRLVTPLRQQDMRSRILSEGDLARHIAEREALGNQRRLATGSGAASRHAAQALVKPAVRFLKAGRRVEAAALFEAALDVAPEDAEAWNNYGFCILTDNPVKALGCFEEAARRGYPNGLVLLANRAYALRAVGQATEALELLEHSAQDILEAHAEGGWLWSFNTADVQIIDVDDTRQYLVSFAMDMAVSTEDFAAAQRWQARQSAIAV